MKYKKPAISISDQVQKLQSRGLTIPNAAQAEQYLSNISYYRLRAYTYPYQDNTNPNHPFVGKVSFTDIVDLYTFDRRLRLLVFDAIERIEIALRTQIIHQWAKTHGGHWHLDQNLYKDRSKFVRHLNSLQREIARSKETFIDHYRNKYTSPPDPPCWMGLEVISMGLLSQIFSNLKSGKEKKAVVHHFGLNGIPVLENWMHTLSNIRNICAHHGRLWNRRIPIPIMLPKRTLHIFVNQTTILPYKLYAPLCAMVYLMEVISPGTTFKQRVKDLVDNCPGGQLSAMGFPQSWDQDTFWK